MFSLTLKTIRAKKARFVLTAVAVMLGVAFMAGTLVLTDTIKQTYDDLAGKVYKDTDAVVRSASTRRGRQRHRPVAPSTPRSSTRSGPCPASPPPSRKCSVSRWSSVATASCSTAAATGRSRSGWRGRTTTALNPMELVDGAAPAAANEIVIDRASADKGDFAVGDTITRASASPVRPSTGSPASPRTPARTTPPAHRSSRSTPRRATEVLGDPGRYDAINVVAAPGVSQTELVADLQTAIANPDVEVITGAAAVEDARTASGSQLSFLNTFLMTFAIVALLVGSFVIYNTFSITVAQRTKETALLRAIGAKRKQVMRSVMFESMVTGLFASAIGVVAGIFTAKGIALGVHRPRVRSCRPAAPSSTRARS